MESFALNKRKIAKAVFVVFSVLLGIFCIAYAAIGITNLVKIKNAFELTITQMTNTWSEGFSNFPLFDIKKGNSYSFNIQSVSDETKKLVATYTPGKEGSVGNISFVNSNGDRANLYDMIGLITGLKEESGMQASYVFDENDKIHYESVECFSPEGLNTTNSFWQKVSHIFEDGFTMPEINKKKLGYNIVLLLNKADLKPGKTIPVFNQSVEVKARKYSVLIRKEHLKDFFEKITLDKSVENTPLVQEMKNAFFEFLQNCQGENFIISVVLHKGKILSVECETPEVEGDSYLLSLERIEEGESVFIKLQNISNKKIIMQASAQCLGKTINISYVNTTPKITVDAKTEDNEVQLNISGKNRLSLNLIAQKTGNSYNMEFYKDKLFTKPPFLNVYISLNDQH